MRSPLAITPSFGKICYPDARPILEIHRGKDGYIIFAKLHDGKWHEWSAPVQALADMFPQFAADLVEDSFFSINSFWCQRRKSDHVRWLNAAFVDVDCEDSEELGTRLGVVMAKADKGEIPKPSYIVFSGTGFWLLWLLVGADSNPPEGIWHNRVLYDRIERELVSRCQADPAAKDIARVMRVPGSRNSKSGAYVRFERLMGMDQYGRIYTYSLPQLGELLGVHGPEMRPTRTGKRNPNFRGHVQRWNQTYIAFNQLRHIRGGAFSDGCRHWACHILALVQSKIGVKAPDIERDGINLARQCRPPLSEADALNNIRSGIRSRKLFREEMIMKLLKVTPEERQQIIHWQQASDHPTRPLPRSERDEVIGRIITDIGFTPSLRTMKRQLGNLGFSCSAETIRKSYLSQGLASQLLPEQRALELDTIKGSSTPYSV